jgi:hypothetical protein
VHASRAKDARGWDARNARGWGARPQTVSVLGRRAGGFFFFLTTSDRIYVLQIYVKKQQHKTMKKMTINLGPNEI